MTDHERRVENIRKLLANGTKVPGREYDAMSDLIAAYDAKCEELAITKGMLKESRIMREQAIRRLEEEDLHCRVCHRVHSDGSDCSIDYL